MNHKSIFFVKNMIRITNPNLKLFDLNPESDSQEFELYQFLQNNIFFTLGLVFSFCHMTSETNRRLHDEFYHRDSSRVGSNSFHIPKSLAKSHHQGTDQFRWKFVGITTSLLPSSIKIRNFFSPKVDSFLRILTVSIIKCEVQQWVIANRIFFPLLFLWIRNPQHGI